MNGITNYICAKCLRAIDRDDAERVGLVYYCPRCAQEHREDALIDSLLANTGALC